MPNIFDYITWRGDLSFSASPFNEVDNLILSELAFIDFCGSLQCNLSEGVTLSDAAELLSAYREEDSVEKGVLLPEALLPLFRKAAESRRFGEISLCAYECRTDQISELQFAAVTFLLGDGTAFVSYRGTDDTLVGWKEDFNMSFLPVVPAQSYAAQYLDRIAARYPNQLRVGGHSKGGNLAVYAAASASLETQRRILQVFNNDGPGFSRDFLDSDGYARVRDRVCTIVPQTSIIGMLLEHECAYTIVKSTESGLFQHDGFSWEVLGTEFVTLQDRTSGSKIVDRTLKSWVASLSEEEREQFVEALYAILCSSSAETLSDIRADKDALLKILRGITPEQRNVLQKTLRRLIYEGQRVIRADRDEQRSEKREERLKKRAAAEEEREKARARDAEEKRERREAAAVMRIKRAKRRAALMVAVRPIRFRIVRAEAPLNRSDSEK